ncbi:hypothetical protein ASS64_16215 [Erythrobacter sp. AP23]|nr:hypothetical protein ASS64_16215 [Erythrobacter sp. AP23]
MIVIRLQVRSLGPQALDLSINVFAKRSYPNKHHPDAGQFATVHDFETAGLQLRDIFCFDQDELLTELNFLALVVETNFEFAAEKST